MASSTNTLWPRSSHRWKGPTPALPSTSLSRATMFPGARLPAGSVCPQPLPVMSCHSCLHRQANQLPRRATTTANALWGEAVSGSEPRRSAWGRAPRHQAQQRNDRRKQQRRGNSLVVQAAEDFYQTLGVDRGADKRAIKTAYRQQARKWHPDVNKEPGADEKFKRISNAYEVLSDDQKRGIYDRYGEAGLRGASGAGGGGAGGMGDFSSAFDIFEQFFGGGSGGGSPFGRQRASRAQPGEDERYDLQLDFLEGVFGTK